MTVTKQDKRLPAHFLLRPRFASTRASTNGPRMFDVGIGFGFARGVKTGKYSAGTISAVYS